MAARRDRIREIKNQADDYIGTVQALLAFSALIVHDGNRLRPSAHIGFGRNMTTSKNNTIEPETDVTPDLVAQKGDAYGVVAEAKKGMSNDPTNWDDHLAQLRKYDDDLVGWWTASQKVSASDATILVHQSRSRRFIKYTEDQVTRDGTAAGKNTAIIEFNRSPETELYIFFRLEWGRLRDSELAGKLGEGKQVPYEKVLQSFSQIQFYDAKPPLALLITLLWTDVFPSLEQLRDFESDEGMRTIRVTAEGITKEMQRAYGSAALERDARSVEFPRKGWIIEALEVLVKLKLAVPGQAPEEYAIQFKPFPKVDVLERFARLTASLEQKTEKEQAPRGQMPLRFEDQRPSAKPGRGRSHR